MPVAEHSAVGNTEIIPDSIHLHCICISPAKTIIHSIEHACIKITAALKHLTCDAIGYARNLAKHIFRRIFFIEKAFTKPYAVQKRQKLCIKIKTAYIACSRLFVIPHMHINKTVGFIQNLFCPFKRSSVKGGIINIYSLYSYIFNQPVQSLNIIVIKPCIRSYNK